VTALPGSEGVPYLPEYLLHRLIVLSLAGSCHAVLRSQLVADGCRDQGAETSGQMCRHTGFADPSFYKIDEATSGGVVENRTFSNQRVLTCQSSS
jgi:hypothetical protein